MILNSSETYVIINNLQLRENLKAGLSFKNDL